MTCVDDFRSIRFTSNLFFPVAIGNAERRIVFPKLIEGRTDGMLSVLVQEDVTLNLRKASVFSDVFDFTTTEGETEVINKVSHERRRFKAYVTISNACKMAMIYVPRSLMHLASDFSF